MRRVRFPVAVPWGFRWIYNTYNCWKWIAFKKTITRNCWDESLICFWKPVRCLLKVPPTPTASCVTWTVWQPFWDSPKNIFTSMYSSTCSWWTSVTANIRSPSSNVAPSMASIWRRFRLSAVCHGGRLKRTTASKNMPRNWRIYANVRATTLRFRWR